MESGEHLSVIGFGHGVGSVFFLVSELGKVDAGAVLFRRETCCDNKRNSTAFVAVAPQVGTAFSRDRPVGRVGGSHGVRKVRLVKENCWFGPLSPGPFPQWGKGGYKPIR